MIFKKIRNNVLFKNTFIYTLVQIINSGIPFLLLPILTRYLTPSDYGLIATYNTFVGVLSIIAGIGIGSIGVFFFHMDTGELKKYIGNVLNILLGTTLLATLFVITFEPYLVSKLKLPAIWLYLAIVVASLQMLTSINLSLWRSEQRVKPFAIYQVFQTLFNVSLSLLLIVVIHYEWEGRVIGITVTTAIFGLFSLLFLFKKGYVVFNYSQEYLKDALKFGVPLIPHTIALWMRSGVDILLIVSLVGVSQTGLYNVGFQFGMVVGIFASAFNNAFAPYLYEKLKNISSKVQKDLVKFTYIYFIGIVIFAMLLSTFFVWLIPYFLGEKFQGASEYIYWISLAYAFQGMYMMVVNYIYYSKKTHLISMVTISTSILHVALSYTLIQQYGAIGAAYASVISFFLTFVLVWRISSKVVEMPWNIWSKQ